MLLCDIHALGLQDEATIEDGQFQRETCTLLFLPDLGDVEIIAFKDLGLEHYLVVNLETIWRGYEIEHLTVFTHQLDEVVHVFCCGPKRFAAFCTTHRKTEAHCTVPFAT